MVCAQYHSDTSKYHQSKFPEIEGFGGNCWQCILVASLDSMLDSVLLENSANGDHPVYKYACFCNNVQKLYALQDDYRMHKIKYKVATCKILIKIIFLCKGCEGMEVGLCGKSSKGKFQTEVGMWYKEWRTLELFCREKTNKQKQKKPKPTPKKQGIAAHSGVIDWPTAVSSVIT